MTYSRLKRHFPHTLQCSCSARAAASRSSSEAVGKIVTPSVLAGVGGPINRRRGPTRLVLHHLAPFAFRRAISTPSIITVPTVNFGTTARLFAILHYPSQPMREPVTKLSRMYVGSDTDVDTKNTAKPQLSSGHAGECREQRYTIINP